MSGPFGSSQWMYKPDAGIPWGGARGVFAGGTNVIDYITIQSTGDAQDFGDMVVARTSTGGGASDGSRGVFPGGYAGGYLASIDYITIASTGDAADFGDLNK